ncbi:MAG: OmpP1/FadL family transporter, partial [Gemmatimonadales bacterium]
MRRFALWLCAGFPSLLAAQGFGIYEHNTCTMGRSGVAAASPCPDGSAAFFNPAGLVQISGNRLSFGATLIRPSGGFTDDLLGRTTDMEDVNLLVPNVFVARRLSPKLGVGLGVFAPYGLGTEWPTDGFEGRFLGYKTSLRTIYVQPTVGYQLTDKFWIFDGLQVGIGVAYVRSTVELHQRLDLSSQTVPLQPFTFAALGIPRGTDFGDAALDASGNGFAVNFGAILKVNDRLSVGGHWLTRKTITFDGTAVFNQINTNIRLPVGNPLGLPAGTLLDTLPTIEGLFAPGGPLESGPATTKITLPPQGSIGVAYKVRDDWTIMADYQLVVWGWFNSILLDFENATTPDITLYEGYTDSHGFRFGTEYRYSPKVTLRGGYLYHTAAAPDETVTPLLPEGARNEFTAGLGLNLTDKL